MIQKYNNNIERIVIDVIKIPENEREKTWINMRSVNSLRDYLDDFGSALSLYEFCRTLRSINPTNIDYMKWCSIAGRDGAMSMYHFSKVLFETNFRDCDYLINIIKFDEIKKARRKFRETFPDVNHIRNAVAHQAENMKNKQQIEKHSFSGSKEIPGIRINNSKNITISNTFIGNKFYYTFLRSIVCYELSAKTFSELVEITKIYYSVFSTQNKSK
jgi:hypothetical protein